MKITEDNWWEFSLFSLECISDPDIRSYFINRYNIELDNLLKQYPLYEDILTSKKSLNQIFWELESAEQERTSNYLFDGCIVSYYPIVREQRALKKKTCAVTGAEIFPGSTYISFKAFLYNRTTKEVFVSKVINMELGCNFDIPYTLHEFEDFYYRVENSYSLDLTDEYNISTQIGGMSLRKLRK